MLEIKTLAAAFILALLFSAVAGAVEAPSATENSWTTKAPMPNDLSIVKAAVANGKIYVMTGSFNYEYDPATDTWTAKKPMPTPRLPSFGIASCNNKIYVIGGGDTDKNTGEPYYFSTNDVYDPLTDTWETKKPMPTARDWVEANVVNGKIYVIGGVHDDYYRYVHTPVNEVYDPSTDSWTLKKPAPIGVIKGASAVVDNKIYIMGGVGDNETLNLISNQIYDTETDTWSFGASLPTAMWYTAAGATTGVMAPKRIYVMGGGTTKVTNVVNVYDPALDNWSALTMPTNRTGHAIAVVNDTLYVMGGGVGWHGGEPPTPGSGWTLTSKVEQYTPFGFGTIRPVVCVISPENKTYNETIVPLTVYVDKPFSWLCYSLDGQDNLTITGNVTLTDLPNGAHNLTVYAKYTEGIIGASENIAFTIAKPEPEPFPTTLVAAASGVSVAVVGAGLLVYFKRRNHQVQACRLRKGAADRG